MATEQGEPVDASSFTEPDVEQSDDDNPLDLDAGESYIGRITAYKPWAGDYGLVEIDGETLWLNKTMQSQLISALVEGEAVMYQKSEETESFENSDGEEQEYHPRSLLFQEGDE